MEEYRINCECNLILEMRKLLPVTTVKIAFTFRNEHAVTTINLSLQCHTIFINRTMLITDTQY